MQQLKLAFVILAVAASAVNAKPSHPFGLHSIPHAIPDHFDFAPPVLPPTHFHAPAPAPLYPAPAPLLPAPAATFLPAPTLHSHLLPAPVLPAPALHSHLFPAPAPVLPAPALHSHLFPAPAHVLPAPALHSHLVPASPATFFPAPEPFLPDPLPLTRVLPPVYEAVQFAAPTYRAIPGPKTTTHHVSVGYAIPAPTFAKFSHAPHAHLHAAPLLLTGKSGYHHPLF